MLAAHIAQHREVMGIDAWIVDADLRNRVESEAADNVKRVKTQVPMDPEAWNDERKAQGLGWIERFLETKTVWQSRRALISLRRRRSNRRQERPRPSAPNR